MAVTQWDETFEGTGGLKIFVRSWQPQGAPRAALVICHGVNSHGGRYKRPAEQFVNSGLAVYALDLRGRGKSEGERFYVEHVADYAGDVAGTVQIAKERHPGPREQNETVATARAQALVRRALDDPATFTRLHAEGATLRDAEVAAVAFASDDA